MNTLLPGIAAKVKIDTLLGLLVVIAWGAGLACGLIAHAPTFTRTIHHNLTVAEQYGAPSQSIPGAQINAALAGVTCDVYQARSTVICHP